MVMSRGIQTFHTSRSHLKFQAAGKVTQTRFHAENPQLSGTTVQKLVTVATWRPGFAQPWWYLYSWYSSLGWTELHFIVRQREIFSFYCDVVLNNCFGNANMLFFITMFCFEMRQCVTGDDTRCESIAEGLNWVGGTLFAYLGGSRF
jgi:hypothetical protein